MSVASDRLAAYLAAEAEILKAQSAAKGDRSFRLAELTAVQSEIRKLQAQVSRETGAGGFKAAAFAPSGDRAACDE